MILRGYIVQDLAKKSFRIEADPIELEDALFIKSVLEQNEDLKVLFGSEVTLHKTKKASGKTMNLLKMAIIK